MSDSWKIELERQLMGPESPSVMTTAMLHGLATAGRQDAPSPATFKRWLAAMAQGGKLVQVIKGVYLNRLGHRDVSPAAAAHWVRTRSVVSLSWVLEQAFVTNNFGDTVTCVIPTRLKRLAKTMGMRPALDEWLQAYAAYQADPDVRENSATRLRL